MRKGEKKKIMKVEEWNRDCKKWMKMRFLKGLIERYENRE